jgi:glycine betaine/choline ABC-type transport system substrate-binding protein
MSNPSRRQALAFTAGMTALFSCQTTPRLTVASKDSVEQRLLAEIVCQLLEKKLAARLERNFGLAGSMAAYQSLQGGVIDLYPEYTRIAYKLLLKAPEQADQGLMLEVMRRGLAANAQANCLPFLGFNNIHTAVVMADHPVLAKLATLTEAAAFKNGWRLGCTSEFAQSTEGYTELKQRYALAESGATRLEPINQLYFGLRERRVDILITGSTDPRLRDSQYRTLADDLGVFSPNYCCLFYRQDAARNYPSILPVLESLSGRLDTPTMIGLNAEVELEKRSFDSVAAEFLAKSSLA